MDNISTRQIGQPISLGVDDLSDTQNRDSSNSISVSFSQSSLDHDMRSTLVGSGLSSRFSVDLNDDLEVNYADQMTSEPEKSLGQKAKEWGLKALKEIGKQLGTLFTINIYRGVKSLINNHQENKMQMQAQFDNFYADKYAGVSKGIPEPAPMRGDNANANTVDDVNNPNPLTTGTQSTSNTDNAGWANATAAVKNLESQGNVNGTLGDMDTGYGQIGNDYGQTFSNSPEPTNIANKDDEFAANLSNNLNAEQIIADDIYEEMDDPTKN